jgi:hypothetical protein
MDFCLLVTQPWEWLGNARFYGATKNCRGWNRKAFLPSAWQRSCRRRLRKTHLNPSPPPSRLNWISGKVQWPITWMAWFDMIWHDLIWMTWFDMNDMIWHEWHDLTWMTWFNMNDMIWQNEMIWHEWHDLTWMTWMTWFEMNDMIWHEWHVVLDSTTVSNLVD